MLVALGFRALAPWYFLTNVLELPQEIRLVAFAALIANTSFTALAALMGVTAEGNFEHHTSVVTRRADLKVVAQTLGRPVEELEGLFETWRPTLYTVRTKRTWPGLDNKLVTAWNGLALSGVAKAYIATGERRFLDAATKTANRLWKLHHKPDGTLYRASNDGVATERGILDDYAFLAVGLLDLFEASGNATYLDRATQLVEKADSLFRRSSFGWFQTAEGDESLIYRHFEPYDSVRPAGNSQMLEAHLRLAGLTGSTTHYKLVNDTLAYYTETLTRSGLGMGGWATVALRYEGPFYEVIIAGDDSAQQEALLSAWRKLKPTWSVKVGVPAAGASTQLAKTLPPVAGKKALNGQALAYVCVRGACKEPTSDPAVFRKQLSEGWKH